MKDIYLYNYVSKNGCASSAVLSLVETVGNNVIDLTGTDIVEIEKKVSDLLKSDKDLDTLYLIYRGMYFVLQYHYRNDYLGILEDTMLIFTMAYKVQEYFYKQRGDIGLQVVREAQKLYIKSISVKYPSEYLGIFLELIQKGD